MTYLKTDDDGKFYDADEQFYCTGCNAPLGTCMVISKDVEPRSPEPGDATACAHCGQLMIFGTDNVPRELTLDEMMKYQQTPAWQHLEEVSEKIKQNPMPL